MNQDTLTAQSLLNCLVREVSGPEEQVREDDGQLIVRLARSDRLLRLGTRRRSAGSGVIWTSPRRARGLSAAVNVVRSMASNDATQFLAEDRCVERMRHLADELSRGASRQLGIGVQGDDIAHAVRDAGEILAAGQKAGVGGAAQQPVEFMQLAPLALPPHPFLLRRVP